MDVFRSMIRLRGQSDRSETISAPPLDFAHAFEHVGVATGQLDNAPVVLYGPPGTPHMFGLRTHPFYPPAPGRLGPSDFVTPVIPRGTLQHMDGHIRRRLFFGGPCWGLGVRLPRRAGAYIPCSAPPFGVEGRTPERHLCCCWVRTWRSSSLWLLLPSRSVCGMCIGHSSLTP